MPRPRNKSERFEMRVSLGFKSMIDAWRAQHPKQNGDLPSMAEAIVRLCEEALSQEKTHSSRNCEEQCAISH